MEMSHPMDYTNAMLRHPPVTVIETPEFLATTRKIMTEPERAALVGYLAHNPDAGDIVPGAGGVRKLRWGLIGRGKRGGARVIYFYSNSDVPLFALSAYAKNARSDLSQADRNDFRRLTKQLLENYGGRKP
jgi:mRNA-degrading endonuclease RelE of RelBE toxin-antitoxin system